MGDAEWSATLKPLHLHNPSTSVGNMEVVDCLEMFTFDFFSVFYSMPCSYLPMVLVTGLNYLLLPTHIS